MPADAWGIAVTKDGARAIVTSAWSNAVSAIDVEKMKSAAASADGASKPTWTVEVPREPRGVTISPEGDVAWVSHLVGAKLTKLRLSPSGPPEVARVALALSPDGSRLFAARHALGALGREAWFGAATVNVLATRSGEGIAPLHQGNAMVYRSAVAKEIETPDTKANLPAEPLAPFTQPRDLRYRKTTRTVLVAGEGDNVLVELDALALALTISVLRTHVLG